jgi:hypothetical protein
VATQATSKATGVTLSTPSGKVTMHNAALAAGTIVSFVLTNPDRGRRRARPEPRRRRHAGQLQLNARCAAGSATIDVRNNTAGSLSEAIVYHVCADQGRNVA